MKRAPDGNYRGDLFFQNVPRGALQPGRWCYLELEMKANTPGSRAGLQRRWIDGVFKGEVFMRLRHTTDLRINAFQLTFSGSVPATQHVWIDNVVVSA
jgi:hypothetical protein